MMPNLGQGGGCQLTEEGCQLGKEVGSITHTRDIPGALGKNLHNWEVIS
jgi:hypothetical protein